MASMRADRRLYVTADRGEIVEEGDPRSAWLLVAEGRDIGPSDVERYGLRMEDGRVTWDAAPAAKMAEAPEDKQMPAPENKAAGLPEDMPGLDKLTDAGFMTLEEVAEVEDLTDIDGIGAVTAERIQDYLAREA